MELLRSSEVCKLLNISRTALSFYVQQGKIDVVKLDNGRYDYVDESVYALRNKRIHKQSYLYLFTEPRFIDDGLRSMNNTISALGETVDHVLIDTDRYKREALNELVVAVTLGRVSVIFLRNGDLITDSAEEIFDMFCAANEIKVIKI